MHKGPFSCLYEAMETKPDCKSMDFNSSQERIIIPSIRFVQVLTDGLFSSQQIRKCPFRFNTRVTSVKVNRLEGSDHVEHFIGIRQCVYRALFYKTAGGKIFLVFLLCEKDTFRRNVNAVCFSLRTAMHQLCKIGSATATNVIPHSESKVCRLFISRRMTLPQKPSGFLRLWNNLWMIFLLPML